MVAQTSLRRDITIAGQTTPIWVHPRRATGSSAELQGDDSRRPVIMIHGFRGDHHGMDLIAQAITDRDVIVPDLPGFGEAPPLAGGLSLQNYEHFIVELVSTVESQWGVAPIIIGHSFGSILVAHTIADHPGIADELVLINPITSPALEGSARLMTALTRLYYHLGARLPERIGQGLLAHPLVVRAMSEVMATTKDRGLRRYIHDQHAKYFSTFSDRSSLAEAFEISVSHTVTEVAEALTMPTLVIAGTEDLIAPIAVTRDFASRLGEAAVVELSSVGHLVHYERPEEAASAIMDFCAGRDE